ncbi:MAG: site-specific DNA-methyltransferase [candidate division Zixibacteria bacterium]
MRSSGQKRLDLIDKDQRLRLYKQCRLSDGGIWHDPVGRHVVGCGDATDPVFLKSLAENRASPTIALHDPPYNMVIGESRPIDDYITFCRKWIDLSFELMADDAALYVWLGADQNDHFRPLPQFMAMMAETGFDARSYITMRNQRGYGTQKNWMALRQELLYYTKGSPIFKTQYTAIPKTVRGYYKTVKGKRTENLARSRSENIRPGNVWVDIQQVFYRMEENVPGCFAQKPLSAIDRILQASSGENDTVLDLFSHSGTTLLGCEMSGRRCLTCDIDPIMAELSIRRLEHYRATGRTGWQNIDPLEDVLDEGEKSDQVSVHSS